MTLLDGYFINDAQHRDVLRALDVLCLAMKQLREDNEKRGDEPDDYIVSCMEVVHYCISEIMFDVLDCREQRKYADKLK